MIWKTNERVEEYDSGISRSLSVDGCKIRCLPTCLAGRDIYIRCRALEAPHSCKIHLLLSITSTCSVIKSRTIGRTHVSLNEDFDARRGISALRRRDRMFVDGPNVLLLNVFGLKVRRGGSCNLALVIIIVPECSVRLRDAGTAPGREGLRRQHVSLD